ncbi:MAG: DoxX family protein [Planctomycetota bacterium]|nr:DoxX family protein [Planctomycetota bacterium]
MSAVQQTKLSGTANVVSWIAQLVAAGILGQTLFFKFSGARESVYIFNELGAEPWGRIGSGVVELVCVVLLLLPRTAALGALLALGTMAGAIGAHLVRLGIEIKVEGESDGGLLFALAVTTVLAALVVLWLRRASLPIVGPKLG